MDRRDDDDDDDDAASRRSMTETLRRKSMKDRNTNATTSSGESVASNPWADTQPEGQPEHTLKTPRSPAPSLFTTRSRSPGPTFPDQPPDSPLIRDASHALSKEPKQKKIADQITTTSTVTTIKSEELVMDDVATTSENTPPEQHVQSSSNTFCKLPPTISIEPVNARPKAKNPFVPTHTRQTSSQSTLMSPSITTTRFLPPSFNSSTHADFFTGQIFVITNGASLIGGSIIKLLHTLGARVIFGDPDTERAKRLIKSIGEPHLVHFNKCDTRSYEDMLDLFRLASTMYGRVDHAIFGVGDDGAATGNIGEGERGWFSRAPQSGIEGVEREPRGLIDTLAAAPRFAHIALAYLRERPKKRNSIVAQDRSLTFLTSVASFKVIPLLPVYQTTQHGILGLVRSLQSSINPETDGVRINAAMTGVMVPRATSGAGGRMSVKLPSDSPEDVSRTVVGIISAGMGEKTIVTRSGGRLHGRVLYIMAGESYDIEEGLGNAETLWLGPKAAEHLARAQEGVGKGSQWIMDLG